MYRATKTPRDCETCGKPVKPRKDGYYAMNCSPECLKIMRAKMSKVQITLNPRTRPGGYSRKYIDYLESDDDLVAGILRR